MGNAVVNSLLRRGEYPTGSQLATGCHQLLISDRLELRPRTSVARNTVDPRPSRYLAESAIRARSTHPSRAAFSGGSFGSQLSFRAINALTLHYANFGRGGFFLQEIAENR